jgi:hypothetical protein
MNQFNKTKYNYTTAEKDKESSKFKKYCTGYEELPTVLPPVKRIIAIGDIHGDYQLTLRCFKIAKLIDDKLNWIAEPKDTVVVQVGDQIDRCRPYKSPDGKVYKCNDPRATVNDEASDIKILKFFTEMHRKAKKYGGGVYSLLGNHEIMNVQGNMSYVSVMGIKEFENYQDPNKKSVIIKDGQKGRQYAFAPGNEYARFLACTRNTSMIIGSNIFVHAGIMPGLLQKYNGNLPKINRLIRKWLLGKINTNNVDEILNSEEISPFWPRVLGNISPNSSNTNCNTTLQATLEVFEDVSNMIIGHTPQFYTNKHGINSSCNGRLWKVDQGASTAFQLYDPLDNRNGDSLNISEKRKVQVLEILDDKIFNVLEYDCKPYEDTNMISNDVQIINSVINKNQNYKLVEKFDNMSDNKLNFLESVYKL